LLPFIPLASATVPSINSSDSGSVEGGTSCTVTVAVGASDDLIAVGINSDAAFSSISDEDGNTYTQRVAETTSHFSYWYTTTSPTTNAANTITITMSSGDTTCFGYVLSGVDTADPIGNTGKNSGSSGTTDTITFSTANNDSMILHTGGDEWNSAKSWDAGKTEDFEILNGGANRFGGASSHESQATAGSNDGTFTWDRDGSAWSHALMEVKSPATATPRTFTTIFG